MTIHAAKGMEFPVVFLPFAHRKFHHDKPPFIDPELGIAFTVKNEGFSSPFYHFLHRFSVQRTEAEEKRIFYVGCTRARDMLVISGMQDGASSHSSCLKWVVESLGLDAQMETGEISLPPAPVKVLEQNGDRRELKEVLHALRVGVTLSGGTLQVNPLFQELPEPEAASPEIRIDPLPGKFQGDFFSATQIRTFLECPTKYYLKYCLGLPERHAVPYYPDEEEEPSDILIGEEEGKLTHAVLQTLANRSILTDDEVRARVRAAISGAPDAKVDDRERAVETITNNVSNFLQSPFGMEILTVDESMAEFSISATFGDDYITGTLDRLYRDHEGRWNIVDFKTDNIRVRDLETRAAIYKPQVALYALLVSRLYGQDSVRASVVFLAHPDRPIHYCFTKADIAAFESAVRDVILKIKGRKFERSVLLCDTCTYQTDRHCLLGKSPGSTPVR
jgi:ATP-dependent exoDNAse (exonuclease V) beta subunit